MLGQRTQKASNGNSRSEPATATDHGDEVNPFEMTYPWTLRKKIEVAIGFIFLLPLRILCSTIILSIGLTLCYISKGWKKTEDNHYATPVTGWRRTAWSAMMPFFSRIWLHSLGFFHVPIIGRMASHEEAAVYVMAPHSSFMDGLLPLIFPYPFSAVTRYENGLVPLLGVLLDMVSPIYIKRAEKDSRNNALDEIVRRSRDPAWPTPMIYVEGTCTNRRALLPFKQGAFSSGLPVQPIILRYDGSPFCIWTFAHPLWLIMITFCTLINHASIEFMEPVIPTDEEKADPKLYAENVRKCMARHMNVPLSTYSHRDFVRMRKEAEKGGKEN